MSLLKKNYKNKLETSVLSTISLATTPMLDFRTLFCSPLGRLPKLAQLQFPSYTSSIQTLNG